MSTNRLQWGEEGTKLFEAGVSQGVLYPYDAKRKTYGEGKAWVGLTSAKITPEGGEETELNADDTKYGGIIGTTKIKAGIEAYMYPLEFEECDGTASVNGVKLGQQERKKFAFSFKTKIGSDTEGLEKGYKIHLLYGCTAGVSERAYSTINDSPEAITFSWDISTTPQEIGEINGKKYNPTAYLCFDSTVLSPENMKKVEDVLYGSETAKASVKSAKEMLQLLGSLG